MPSVATFVRKTPAVELRAYFDNRGIALPAALDWSAPEAKLARPILQAVDEMDVETRARIANDVERVGAMADEAGQAAIFGVAPDREQLAALPNGYARALWLFVNDYVRFRQAEEVRYTDDRRRGRMWDGFIGTANIQVRRDQASLEAFMAAVKERFESGNVQVDVFDRHRPTFEGEDCEIVQVTVYREGHPDDFLEFVGGTLDRRVRRPVFEAALTYETKTGVIEVVAKDREGRPDLVRLFARDLLATEFQEERLPLRRYDLEGLLEPHAFPTDPEDGIQSVRVSQLRLMPLDAQGERVTLECMRDAETSIWEMAKERFGDTDPLCGDWIVTQARLSIRFHPEPGASRGKTLPLTITMPHGCDLKDRTDRERLVGEKYLRRWGIVCDV